MNIGMKIKRLRTLCGLTQGELADRCELTKGFISQVENNLTSPTISTLNDILIALTGDPTNKGSEESWVGRTAIYREKECALLNQRMCKIIPNTKYILPKYLYYYLISYPTLYTLASSAKGSANQANISHKDVGELDISLPSIEMQQHIVDIRRCYCAG